MSDTITPGFKASTPNENHPAHFGQISVCVYQPPFFGPIDPLMKVAPRLRHLRAIYVTRRVSIHEVCGGVVCYEDGTEINKWARQRLPLWLKNRIKKGLEESLRQAGGGRTCGKGTWYKP